MAAAGVRLKIEIHDFICLAQRCYQRLIFSQFQRCVLAVSPARVSNTASAPTMAPKGTIKKWIQQLEKELGYPLFERTNRSVALTAFGEAYLPLARKMYQTTQEMYSLNTEAKEMTGALRVGIVESLFFLIF